MTTDPSAHPVPVEGERWRFKTYRRAESHSLRESTFEVVDASETFVDLRDWQGRVKTIKRETLHADYELDSGTAAAGQRLEQVEREPHDVDAESEPAPREEVDDGDAA